MRFVPTACLREGMIVGKSLYDRNGNLLIKWGGILKEAYICKIKELGYQGVYVEDEASEDIEVNNTISDELKIKAIQAIKNTFVYTNLESKGGYKEFEKQICETQLIIEDIIKEIFSNDFSMVNMLDLKVFDEYTFYHSVNVAVLSIVLGVALDLNRSQLSKLGLGAMLHDIGKVFVPKEVLNKNGKLTDEEFEEIKKHSEYGYRYLKQSYSVIPTVYGCALQHHERYDGEGYPNRLKGDNISLFGRIISICDVYDALTSNRTYRKALLPSEAMEYIMANSGSMFDPNLVKIFVKKVAPYPVGTAVKLSNGMIGIVAQNYEECCMRPKIKILKDEKESEIEGFFLDLRDDMRYINITVIATVDM